MVLKKLFYALLSVLHETRSKVLKTTTVSYQDIVFMCVAAAVKMARPCGGKERKPLVDNHFSVYLNQNDFEFFVARGRIPRLLADDVRRRLNEEQLDTSGASVWVELLCSEQMPTGTCQVITSFSIDTPIVQDELDRCDDADAVPDDDLSQTKTRPLSGTYVNGVFSPNWQVSIPPTKIMNRATSD